MYTWLPQACLFKIPAYFFLLKMKFPCPKKCKMSDLVVASSSTWSLSVIVFNKFSFFIFKEQICWDRTPNVSSSPQWYQISCIKLFQFSLTFLQNLILPPLQIKFPDLSQTLKNFFPDHFLTCGSPGKCKHQSDNELQVSVLNRLQNAK